MMTSDRSRMTETRDAAGPVVKLLEATGSFGLGCQVGYSMMRRRLLKVFAAAFIVAAVCVYAWNLRHPVTPTLIFQGVTYGCERLESDEQGSGLVHWVRVDLTAAPASSFS